MIINELQASTAITSKELYPLNTNKLTNIQLWHLCWTLNVLPLPSSTGKAQRLQHTGLICLSCRIRKYKQLLHIPLPNCLPHSFIPLFSSPLLVSPFLCPPSSFQTPSLSHFNSTPFLSSLLSAVLSHHSLSLRFRSPWGQKPCMKNEITSIRWPWQWRINPHQLGSDSSP